MKTPPNNQTYVSTSQAAKMLGLSVGTVQRMVQNGVFKAFVTHGGHRRILSTSLRDYCVQQGLSPATPLPASEEALICILHDSTFHAPALDTLVHWPQVTVMTHPLDLMDLDAETNALFIDARIPWLHTTPLHLDSARLHNTHLVVYNSQHLPAGSPLAPSPQLSLFEGDISTDLVYGYLLCTRHAQEGLAAHH
ncbi:helix-turn-helix domain-containing protein [Limnohabitans sp. 63ED37-2]|uniref:helix-turn-helix domain-containing protein n=1 Tax=Limnohabitans sp. 63ED37-2 TaxID=1678128 RepID=UPI000706D32F|nr:helix-turn-helix domain-containing protein [Limnohabitans sp. 63ED37-2]ALK87528.1 Helix-turn-helix domain protein [Limnohabitans sp. 63ED37-2]